MTQVKSVMTHKARMARAIAGQDRLDLTNPGPERYAVLTREQKLIARQMSRRDATTKQIATAIDWPWNEKTLRKRLAEIGVRPGRYRAHIKPFNK